MREKYGPDEDPAGNRPSRSPDPAAIQQSGPPGPAYGGTGEPGRAHRTRLNACWLLLDDRDSQRQEFAHWRSEQVSYAVALVGQQHPRGAISPARRTRALR